MNVRHLVPSVSRRLLSMGCFMLAAGLQLAGSRLKRRPLEVQAHRSAVHRGAGSPRGHLWQERAIMGLLEPGPGPARLQAGPLPPIEGGRRRGAGTVEIRR